MTDRFTKDQDEEADNEETHEDDQDQEHDEMTSRSDPRIGQPRGEANFDASRASRMVVAERIVCYIHVLWYTTRTVVLASCNKQARGWAGVPRARSPDRSGAPHAMGASPRPVAGQI